MSTWKVKSRRSNKEQKSEGRSKKRIFFIVCVLVAMLAAGFGFLSQSLKSFFELVLSLSLVQKLTQIPIIQKITKMNAFITAQKIIGQVIVLFAKVIVCLEKALFYVLARTPGVDALCKRVQKMTENIKCGMCADIKARLMKLTGCTRNIVEKTVEKAKKIKN